VTQIHIVEDARELGDLRRLWEDLYAADPEATMFQSYEWNQTAAEIFENRERLFVVAIENDRGAAIIPAVVNGEQIRLIGEELFDYRGVLASGDPEVVRSGFVALGVLDLPFAMTALRRAPQGVWVDFEARFYAGAPICRPGAPRDRHPRLQRRLERMVDGGCDLQAHSAPPPPLVAEVYEAKANAQSNCLFHDRLRIDAVNALTQVHGEGSELFLLRDRGQLVSGALTFFDRGVRRFYGTYSDRSSRWAKLSPGVALANHVTQSTLDAGSPVDLMTGEQPYKLRLASDVVPLYGMEATAARLRNLGSLPMSIAA